MRRAPAALAALLLLCSVPGFAPAAERPRLTDADLAPLSWGTRDAEARAAAAQGRCAQAAALVDAPGPGPRLVRAAMLDCAHAPPAEVVGATEGLSSALPVAAPRVAALRAEALLTLDRAAEALELVEHLDTPAGRRLRARALRETGDRVGARAAYDALIASPSAEDRALGLLGRARLAADGPAEAELRTALLDLRRLDREHPTHWAAETGRRLAKTLIDAHPGLRPAFEDRPPEERLARAERQMDAQRNEEAAAALTALLTPKKGEKPPALSRELRCQTAAALGRAQKKLRRWKEARAALEQAVAACEKVKGEALPTSLYHLAAALDRLGFEKESAAAYERLRATWPNHRLADDAGFFLVRHALDDKKDWAAARAEAERLARHSPAGDMTAEAVAFVVAHALADDRLDDAAGALHLLDALPRPEPRDHDGGRAEYWRARVAELRKAPRAEVVAAYGVALAQFPLGWYSVLAYNRLRVLDPSAARSAAAAAFASDLGQPGPPGGLGADFALEVPAAVTPAALDEALLYARLGLPDAATEALAAAGDDPETLWFEAWLLDRAGAYHDSHELLRRRLPEFRRLGALGPYARWWRLAFPTPFGPLVRQAAKDTKMPAPFLWGVMREESGFNPAVESWANAVGLMQLIVPTAKRMANAAELAAGPIDRDRLTDPALNVALGARYLAYVLGDVGGEKALPVLPAGYNAGEGALKRWLTARGHLPVDLFVELIPFEEARGYTKRVFSSFATYRFLYGEDGAGAGPPADDPLPAISFALPR